MIKGTNENMIVKKLFSCISNYYNIIWKISKITYSLEISKKRTIKVYTLTGPTLV